MQFFVVPQHLSSPSDEKSAFVKAGWVFNQASHVRHSPLHHWLMRSRYMHSHHRPSQPTVAANLSYNNVSSPSSIFFASDFRSQCTTTLLRRFDLLSILLGVHSTCTAPTGIITSDRSSQKGISPSRRHFYFLFKKVKPRISFDFNRLLFWAFVKLSPVLIFDFWSIRPVHATKITKISVLIFDFCPYKGGPNT